MNVAIFASAFYPHVGGVEELCRQLGRALLRVGDHPLIVTNRWPKDLAERQAVEGLDVRRFVFRVPERNWRQMGGAVLYGPSTLRAVCSALRAHATQVIHVQCVSSNAHYAALAARRLGLPLVVSLQGELTMDAGGLFQRSEFARSLMRRMLSSADAITACSAQTLREAEEFYGRPLGERAQVIYNGIRLADFEDAEPFAHARPYILALGRHVQQKGFDVLLRAFAEAARDARFTHDLLLAGGGPESAGYVRMTAQMGLTDRVRHLGRVDHATAVRLFAGCSFFVLPSRQEPMGIVNLEAMAARKPVVASRVGGVPELIADGTHGLLVRAGDVPSLAAAIVKMAGDQAFCARAGEAARLQAGKFDWDAIAQQYRIVYRRVLRAGQLAAAMVM
jgi:glycogen(starch) synthase